MRMAEKLTIGVIILSFAVLSPAIIHAASKPNPQKAIEILKQGNNHFVSGNSKHPDTIPNRLCQAGTDNQGDHAITTGPSTHDLVRSRQVKVVGDIYNIGTGRVKGLPDYNVGNISARAESNPSRAMNDMASVRHKSEGGTHQIERVEVKAVATILAETGTMDILNKNWLHETSIETHTAEKAGLSKNFWIFIALILSVGVTWLFLLGSGAFNRISLNTKLIASYGSLVVLIVILGVASFYYVLNSNRQAHLEVAMLELDMMVGEINTHQNSFLLHGIENKEYGERQVEMIAGMIGNFKEDTATIKSNQYLDKEHKDLLDTILKDIIKYEGQFGKVVSAYHEIEEGKKELDVMNEETDGVLEELTLHFERSLTEAENQGANMIEISKLSAIVEHLMTARIHLLKAFHGAVEFLLDKNPKWVNKMEQEVGMAKGYLAVLKQELTEKDDLAKINATEASLTRYVSILKNMIRDEALIEEETFLMQEELTDIKNLSIQAAIELEAVADGLAKEAEAVAIILSFIAVALGILLMIFVGRSISKPIVNVVDNLTYGAEQVSSASEQVSQSGQHLASGASEQASSLEEVSSSLEEMASMTRQNADNANQANQVVAEVRTAAEKSGGAMSDMSTAISKIKQSSDETAKIVKTIDEIAFQTNLLALNAAVEAARAGESGKGFAVVAEEVRNLAQRSAEAAKNTSSLIEESRKNAENGVNVSGQVEEILKDMSGGIQKVSQLISEVSAASDEQAQGIDQVNTAVSQMDQITQNVAANAEESASAGEELSSQAVQLNEMIDILAGIISGGSRIAELDYQAIDIKANEGDRSRQRTVQQVHGSLGNLKHRPGDRVEQDHKQSGLAVTTKANQTIVKPEDVIPLDDEELKRF